MLVHAFNERVIVDFAEKHSKGDLLLGREGLVAEKDHKMLSQAASISLNVSSSKVPRSTLAISAPSAPAIGLTSIRQYDATVLRLSSGILQEGS